MILMRPNTLLGPLEGVGLENLDFFGPNGLNIRFPCCYFRAQKRHDFQGPPPLPMALEIDLPASKS